MRIFNNLTVKTQMLFIISTVCVVQRIHRYFKRSDSSACWAPLSAHNSNKWILSNLRYKPIGASSPLIWWIIPLCSKGRANIMDMTRMWFFFYLHAPKQLSDAHCLHNKQRLNFNLRTIKILKFISWRAESNMRDLIITVDTTWVIMWLPSTNAVSTTATVINWEVNV